MPTLSRKELFYVLTIGALILFNAYDAFASVLFVVYLGSKELNPISNALVKFDPNIFAVFKVASGLFVGKALWEQRDAKGVRTTTYILAAFYAVLFIYEAIVTIFLWHFGVDAHQTIR